jgi:hypothetical protein
MLIPFVYLYATFSVHVCEAPVDTVDHVGLLEGLTALYDVPGAGIIFPHTITDSIEPVAESPVTDALALPCTLSSPNVPTAPLAENPDTSASAVTVSSPAIPVVLTPERCIKAPGT